MHDGILANGPLRAVFDAIPSMIFVVDDDVVVLDANKEARRVLGPSPELVLRRLCGEVLRCLHSDEAPADGEPQGCGTTESCKRCVLRSSTTAALALGPVSRHHYKMTVDREAGRSDIHLLVSANPFDYDGRRLVLLILEDVTEVVELRRLIPICAWCKRVRADGEYQASLEAYLVQHAGVDITHSICPECAARVAST